ncbi:MAG: GNAT family N-acetyltransferase [Planctomycetaceae bacterium]
MEFSGTARLTAQRLTLEHRPEYFRLLQDPAVMATMSPDGRPLSAELATEWLGYSVAHWEKHGFGYWILKLKESGEFVGRGGLRTTTIDGTDDVELAYAILPEFWNRGLTTEFAKGALAAAFKQLHVPHVLCYTLASNRASQRVMEKCGFRYEKEVEHANQPHVFYRITAAEFATIR